jgi:cell division protein ZapA
MDNADTAKRTVRVTIFNQSYSVSTSGNSADMERLAIEVDDLMSSIARRAGNLDATRTAVLACLHLADRLRVVEGELDELRNAVNHRTRDFALLLDEVLSPSH